MLKWQFCNSTFFYTYNNFLIVTTSCFHLKERPVEKKPTPEAPTVAPLGQKVTPLQGRVLCPYLLFLYHYFFCVFGKLIFFSTITMSLQAHHIFFLCYNVMHLFKEPTVVKKTTPETPKPTVVPTEQKVSPSPRGRLSISMFFVGFFFCLSQLFSFFAFSRMWDHFVLFTVCLAFIGTLSGL